MLPPDGGCFRANALMASNQAVDSSKSQHDPVLPRKEPRSHQATATLSIPSLGPLGEVAPVDTPHGPTAPSTALLSPSGDTQDPGDLPGLVHDLGPRTGARGCPGASSRARHRAPRGLQASALRSRNQSRAFLASPNNWIDINLEALTGERQSRRSARRKYDRALATSCCSPATVALGGPVPRRAPAGVFVLEGCWVIDLLALLFPLAGVKPAATAGERRRILPGGVFLLEVVPGDEAAGMEVKRPLVTMCPSTEGWMDLGAGRPLLAAQHRGAAAPPGDVSGTAATLVPIRPSARPSPIGSHVEIGDGDTALVALGERGAAPRVGSAPCPQPNATGTEPGQDVLGDSSGTWREQELVAWARWLSPGGPGHVAWLQQALQRHGGDTGPTLGIPKLGGSQRSESSTIRWGQGLSAPSSHSQELWGGHIVTPRVPLTSAAISGLQKGQHHPVAAPKHPQGWFWPRCRDFGTAEPWQQPWVTLPKQPPSASAPVTPGKRHGRTAAGATDVQFASRVGPVSAAWARFCPALPRVKAPGMLQTWVHTEQGANPRPNPATSPPRRNAPDGKGIVASTQKQGMRAEPGQNLR
ncbi:hypothetical protein Anapl_14458 [Anas platyrhynchos]|uniref:Uncharacterized protein n=1 Tax=Anas platyrhynchos TaxID=8839 RepID=R0KAS4_ANAPL|nr:hypothetical protein Anapl_14458 [Anas platyrhynchos]